jgi:Zn-finger nucleic acid-binding protein
MPMVECPNCAAKLNASATAEGHTIRCPQCGEVFVLRFPVRSDAVIEIYGPTGPAPAAPPVTPDPPRAPRSRRRTSNAYNAESSEPGASPWLILDFSAVLRGSDTIVMCRVKNPEPATLEIKLVGSRGPGAIEVSFAPNHPTASKKEFATGRFPVGTPVSATLFDAARNARHRANALVAAELSDRSADPKKQ